ncbi:ROK family protein [Dinghuibacter silviterrae]|uniref:ROK family protein n=1 Tax=Dinghuibacter silviterrae TaxID=1539049 RepID=UPI001FE70C3C|nr:ROK family protein [Dinghuibacter silviterrae]
MTKILNELVEEGYAVDTGLAPSTGGRRSLRYALRPDVMYVVSVAVDQFITRIVLLDMYNKPLGALEKFELPLEDNPRSLQELTDRIDDVIRASGVDRGRIAGVGIGMPGFVDPIKGVNFTFLAAPSGTLTAYMEDRLQLPVFIGNDSSLIALAELKFGAARDRKTAMVINISWGIGLGLVLNSELFRGENGFAGEFSHLPLFLNGKICSCGKRGCLETEASLLVVLDKAREGLKQGKQSLIRRLSESHHEEDMEAVTEAARRGDQFAIGLLSEAGYTLGRGAAVLIHLLNPETIILSGRGASPGILWQTPIQQALNEHCIPRLASGTSIQVSTLGYNAAIIGAAALVMDHHY